MLPPQTSKSSTGGRPVTGSICRWTHHCPDVAARSARLSPSREICKLTVWGRPSRVLALSCHWLDRSDQSINQSTNRCVTLDSTTILFSQSATGRPAVTLFLLLRWDECFCPEVELAGIGESGPGSICRLTRGHSVAACGFGELPAGGLSSTCWSQSATRKADVAHTITQSGRFSCSDVELVVPMVALHHLGTASKAAGVVALHLGTAAIAARAVALHLGTAAAVVVVASATSGQQQQWWWWPSATSGQQQQ